MTASRTNSIVAFRTTPGQDFVFRYSGNVIDSANLLPWSMFGPNEHDLTLLADGKTIMAAIRYDGNDDCGTVTHRTPAPFTSTGYTTYYQSFSSDGGSRWSTATPMLGMGSVRPRLHLLRPSGPLLLSGGRFCAEGIGGLFMWVNHDGMGETWAAVDLAAVHDRLVQRVSRRRRRAAAHGQQRTLRRSAPGAPAVWPLQLFGRSSCLAAVEQLTRSTAGSGS